ncbi:unnamed protein product [Pleuronectes platessa]|uniref:Uncharacterized protein n=1 Tax=Pleuronectes platessa TaxID=8262 RepID=A0A9N7YGF2_PLEPL|nr:unnamed protein product [Pleuronectes platessa]
MEVKRPQVLPPRVSTVLRRSATLRDADTFHSPRSKLSAAPAADGDASQVRIPVTGWRSEVITHETIQVLLNRTPGGMCEGGETGAQSAGRSQTLCPVNTVVDTGSQIVSELDPIKPKGASRHQGSKVGTEEESKVI